MGRIEDKKRTRQARRTRIRGRLQGTTQRPRLSVFRSARHIYAQIVDDAVGAVLASASTMDNQIRETLKTGGNMDAAREVGKLIAQRAASKKIENVAFDRGGFKYHGRVQALAEAAREGGLKF
ncbi:MAG: 50S ribosomal protein L18 [bacterium]|nr:50S ribosomal protein L18 [bacterium]MDT8395896.1 50S ribosomal protein L18 [bacterium]